MLPAPRPDILCEIRASLRRCGADHLHGRGHRHRIRFAPHGENGAEPRAETRGALAGGVVLYREPSDSGTPERVRTADVAAPARPEEIGRLAVFLMAVEVADLNVALGAAQGADPRTRRRAGVGAIAERPVGDRFLAPVLPARRLGQSRSSSLPSSPAPSSSCPSSSSSSAGATMSAMVSSWSWRDSFSSSSSPTWSLRSATSSR